MQMKRSCVKGRDYCPGPDAALSDPPRCSECIAKHQQCPECHAGQWYSKNGPTGAQETCKNPWHDEQRPSKTIVPARLFKGELWVRARELSALQQRVEELEEDVARYENGRVILGNEIDRLKRERDEYRECAKGQADRAWQRLSDEPPAARIEVKEFEERSNAWHAVVSRMLGSNPDLFASPKTGLECALSELDRLYGLAEPSAVADEGQQLAQFTAYFEKNYYGEVFFSDPAWHAKRVFAAAKHALNTRASTPPNDADGERYRWLRDTGAVFTVRASGSDGSKCELRDIGRPAGELDEAIDAARGATTKEAPPESAWERDDSVLLDLLHLADTGGECVTLEDIAGWTDEQCQYAEQWAAAVHLRASDNDEVEVPPRPTCVDECATRNTGAAPGGAATETSVRSCAHPLCDCPIGPKCKAENGKSAR